MLHTPPLDKNFQVGVYGAYVLPIHKFHMFVAMGRYLYKPLYPAGMWYHKFGGRFQIIDKLWANISIKSHWAKADYFEYRSEERRVGKECRYRWSRYE